MNIKITWIEFCTFGFSLGILYHYLIRDIYLYKKKNGYFKLKNYVEQAEKGINEISN